MKIALIDIGELGWSLYLSAYVRWLKRNTGDSVAIITYPDRRCLYEGMADIILDVPESFYSLFPIQNQQCLGLIKVLPIRLKNYFLPYIPTGYAMPGNFIFKCYNLKFPGYIYEPFKHSHEPKPAEEILVFPRYRKGRSAHRNLPEFFYAHLIERLCDEFPKLIVRTIGTDLGAYNISVEKPNYINWIGKGGSLQDLIDRCQVAKAVIGSQSAPPKISLLQGAPTFMIGHQRQRHVKHENWMGTKAGFYDIARGSYGQINIHDCIEKIILFVKECLGKENRTGERASFVKEYVEGSGWTDKIIPKEMHA